MHCLSCARSTVAGLSLGLATAHAAEDGHLRGLHVCPFLADLGAHCQITGYGCIQVHLPMIF